MEPVRAAALGVEVVVALGAAIGLGCSSSVVPAPDAVGASGSGGVGILMVFSSRVAQYHEAILLFQWPVRPEPESEPSQPCTKSTDGACTLRTCEPVPDTPSDPSDSPGGESAPNPGTLTLSHAGIDEPVPVIVGSAIQTLVATGALWTAPGEPVGFSGTGGDVPAFSLTVPSPGYFTVTEPVFPPSGPMTVSTTADLTVAWSGAKPGSRVSVGVTNGKPYEVDLNCDFPADVGRGVVPSSLLRQMPKVTTGGLIVSLQSQSSWTIQGWDFEMEAWTYGNDPSGTIDTANFEVVLE